MDNIDKAHDFAERKHRNQKDDCGKDYFQAHIFPVALAIHDIVPDDTKLIEASFLHDTLEDTDTTYEELVSEFGKEVADLVNEVTHEGEKDQYGYYFPRLHTPRAIVLKLLDRASNISRMDSWNEKRQIQYLKKSKFWRSSKEE